MDARDRSTAGPDLALAPGGATGTPDPRARCPYGECDGDGFVVDEVARIARDCRCRRQRIAAARTRRLNHEVPPRFRDVGFDRAPVKDMDPTVVRGVRRYCDTIEAKLDGGDGIGFVGDVGTGKTTLAMLVSMTALRHSRTVAIYPFTRLLAELRDSYRPRDDDRDAYLPLMDRLASVDLLHLDDLGAERTTDWTLEQVYSLINDRYEARRAIVYTTNVAPDALADRIGERTTSRLVEICGDPIPMHGLDLRRVYRAPQAAPHAFTAR